MHLPSARRPIRLPVAKNLLLDSLDEPAGLSYKLVGLLPAEIRKRFVVGYPAHRLCSGKGAPDFVGDLSGPDEMVAETADDAGVGERGFLLRSEARPARPGRRPAFKNGLKCSATAEGPSP